MFQILIRIILFIIVILFDLFKRFHSTSRNTRYVTRIDVTYILIDLVGQEKYFFFSTWPRINAIFHASVSVNKKMEIGRVLISTLLANPCIFWHFI